MMSVGEVHDRIGPIPFMTTEQAETMSAFIQRERPRSVLELGFYHGVSTCYIANAVAAYGGSVVAIDKERGRELEPNVEQLLALIGQRERVELFYEPTSYVWRLMRFIEDGSRKFDLCYLDGAHNWFVDGFAFFLVDKLLNPGGWIILDDLDFSYERSENFRRSGGLATMPQEERGCLQVRKVYELLVKTQPGYGNFREESNWAYAQKLTDNAGSPVVTTREVVVKEKHVGLGAALIKLGRRIGLR